MNAEKFWQRVDTSAGPDACHPWLGCRTPSGHGQVRWHGKTRPAHQVAWELATGQPWPAGKIGLHECDTPDCCNPRHTHPATHAENRADCVAKKRHARGQRNGRAKLTMVKVQQMRVWWRKGLVTQAELARMHQVSQRAISFALSGVHWNNTQDVTP